MMAAARAREVRPCVEVGPGDSAVIPAGTRHAPTAGPSGATLVTAMPVGMRILPDEGEPRVAPWAG
ncbi:MAG TPA: hypothetical protein VNO17_00555 [Actinomycetota bacterium]|nr:hypothetical protein [Actinomycetota bacterium]